MEYQNFRKVKVAVSKYNIFSIKMANVILRKIWYSNLVWRTDLEELDTDFREQIKRKKGKLNVRTD